MAATGNTMDRPNVLILFTDQQRYDTIHAAGYGHMITPNLDRLAADGCIFTNAYTSNPVCMAARHDLLTGLRANDHGYYSNQGNQSIKDYAIPTVARVFSENGYRTAAIGKMHFRPQRMHHGYSELIQMEEIPHRRQDDQYASFLKEEGLGDIQNIHGVRANLYYTQQTSQMDEAHHPNRWVAERSVEWLKHNGDEPFFLFSSWIHPHPPWATPPEFRGQYKSRDIPNPIPKARAYPFNSDVSEWHGDNDSPEKIRSAQEAYYSCVTHVDHHIGTILDYLEQTGKIENTLIIFTSDHGEMLYDRGMHQKSLPYEGSAHVPFIVRYPEKSGRGTKSDRFVDLIDIFPTCLDVCELSYPKSKYKLEGDSVFAEQPTRSRDHQFSCYDRGDSRWVMNRDHRYKYIYYYDHGTEELFDMVNDPGETRNLVGSPELPQADFERLKRQAVEFERRHAPAGMVEGDSFVAIKGKGRAISKAGMYGNTQFHLMDEVDATPRERGEKFIRECEHAIAVPGNFGRKLTEVFNDPSYIDSFMKAWSKFGGDADARSALFSSEAAGADNGKE
ncbi:MAG: sulfatase [Paenibacillaceae bacterium]|nr:sulfatase [Paenibacillaceae bacterium]